ncbi:MAG: hypothetical protein IT581_23460 [Verrucomicrobiales bacterium]|nr:hypothetical protein [Verrucomicrobiales bacterium]
MRPSPQVRRCRGWIGGLWFVAFAISFVEPAPTTAQEQPVDDWLTPLPAAAIRAVPSTNETTAAPGDFATLRTEITGSRAKVAWTPSPPPATATTSVTLVYSVDAPGHWEVRDWQSIPMQRGTNGWNASLPVHSLSVPIAYFVRASGDGFIRASPPRLFRPLLAGLEEPTHPFTGFLDGFEHGIDGWSGATGREPEGALSLSTNALSGTGALRLEVPKQRSSIAVGTVRVRGWMLWEFNPTALRLSARAPHGPGRVRCNLVANARTDEIQVFQDLRDHAVDRHWTRLEIPIADFGGIRLRDVDWMTIQFLAEPGEDLLVDDVELVLP